MNTDEHFFLARELKSGKVKAFDSLMDSLYEKLCAYAFTLTHDHASAEDIVQNVFLRLWINRKNINPNFSIQNFLYKSVYNEFVDEYRKNRHVTSLEKKYLDTLDIIIQNEPKNLEKLIDLVNQEIEKLPPKCRRIFLLNKKEGLTHIEISEYLDISLKTVEWHITNAFKILRKKLDPNTIGPTMFLLFGLPAKFKYQNSFL